MVSETYVVQYPERNLSFEQQMDNGNQNLVNKKALSTGKSDR